MNFFEKINKTVSDASQKTIERTKEVADISRLNSLISEEEKNINNLYLEVGKMYASIHKEDAEKELVNLVEKINIAQSKMDEYRKKIQGIRGVQVCEKCGAEVKKGTAFCSICGYKIPVQQTPKVIEAKCSKCGTSVKRDMKFCNICGNPIDWDTMFSEEKENIEDNEKKQFCPNCGVEIGNGFAFCPNCGSQVTSVNNAKEM